MPRDLIAQRPGTLIGLLDVGLGGALVFGAASRTSSLSFATAKQVAPVEAWGLAFLAVGLLLLWALRLDLLGIAAALTGAALHTFWAVAFLAAAIWDGRAALTGIPVYMFVALVHLTVAVRLSLLRPTSLRRR